MPSQNYNSETSVTQEPDLKENTDVVTPREFNIVWKNVIKIIFLHATAAYGLYLFFAKAMWFTRFWTFFGIYMVGCSITAGSHRLWAHRSYKAKLPLRLMLVVGQTFCMQDSIIKWVRDHRMHHKYSETDADPHNAKRGFFFSHVGWLLVRKHPDVMAKAHTVDVSDLWADPLLSFQHKYYVLVSAILGVILPTYIPIILWGETMRNSFFVGVMFRYVYTLHITFMVNSLAHIWGMKPYDKNEGAVESKTVYLFTLGEGFHNYHHAFPWDYKAAELGDHSFNVTKLFIDAMAKIGWAYDLRTVTPEIIEKRVKRMGDGSHTVWSDDESHNKPE